MKKKKSFDQMMILAVGILIIAGLVILYSTSAYNGRVKFQDSFYYLKKQLFATILGITVMYIVANMDYHIWERIAIPAYITAMCLSVAVLLFGREYNGSRRWLSLGPFSFQPSEFSKIALIIFVAAYITGRKKQNINMFFMAKCLCFVIPVVGLVGAANLSTAIIILGIAVVLLFIASPKYGQFIWMGIAGAGLMSVFLVMESYRLERIAVWRNPEQFEKGYQTMQGLYAIGSGGVFGTGLGNSVQKLGFVPEAQNDMIFSVICEEAGLAGAVIILIMFLILLWRICLIAVKCKDLFGTLLASGVMAHIMIQVILNIAVVTNSIPNTGITLPFISFGGTSVLFLLIEMGLVLSVSGLVK